MFQHYRRSVSFALALGLPWLGSLHNTLDGLNYTEGLGLCQPLCANLSDLRGFDNVTLPESAINFTTNTFKMPEGIQKPTVLWVSEVVKPGAGWLYETLDEHHAPFLNRLRDRFL